MISIKKLLVKMLSEMEQSSETLAWASGTDGSGLYLQRYGKVRVLKIANPTKLAVGNNIVHTLQEKDRPVTTGNTVVLIQPVGAIAAGGNFLSLRASIQTNGNIEIYNYRSTAINGNTNQSGSIAWIVA